jgi:hypothetical protein
MIYRARKKDPTNRSSRKLDYTLIKGKFAEDLIFLTL